LLNRVLSRFLEFTAFRARTRAGQPGIPPAHPSHPITSHRAANLSRPAPSALTSRASASRPSRPGSPVARVRLGPDALAARLGDARRRRPAARRERGGGGVLDGLVPRARPGGSREVVRARRRERSAEGGPVRRHRVAEARGVLARHIGVLHARRAGVRVRHRRRARERRRGEARVDGERVRLGGVAADVTRLVLDVLGARGRRRRREARGRLRARRDAEAPRAAREDVPRVDAALRGVEERVRHAAVELDDGAELERGGG
jgi:hypothetical protein